MVHFGHANAMRQAKALGRYLVVGVISDATIAANKGPPGYPEEERYKLIRAIKWADEVVEDAPYIVDADFLDSIGCDFIAHGDDVCISQVTGGDSYQQTKTCGRYKEFKRTMGISTTDIIGRILRMTKEHHQQDQADSITKEEAGTISQGPDARSPYTKVTQYIPTSNQIFQFSNGGIEPKPGDKIVYTAGSFDMLHAGHVDFLEKAAKQGDYLIVGVHTDQVVNKYKGSNYPVMNMHERVMSVLSLKYSSEVVIGAPYSLSPAMMTQFKTYYLLRICAYSFPAFCQEYLARNPGYYVVPMKVNGSAVKSLFSQFKYASGGKLLSANYETAKRSVMIRKNIHGPRVAKGYRDQPIFTHAVPLPGPKKKRK